MIKYLILVFVPLLAFAESSMDAQRWYLNPEGQDLLITIDDLHDERVEASPKMKWGRDIVPKLELKKEIVIAIIDGGIDIDHPELKDHIAYNAAECFEGSVIPPKDGEDKDKNGYKGDCAGWDFVGNTNRAEDEDGHGTHVTGIIHSVMDGIKGTFKFLPLKAFAPGEGSENVKVSTPLPTRLTKAFEYAISRDVDVIHMSVGWPKSYMTYELELAIKKALDKGIIIVSAAGNSSQRATIFPCQMEGVICVGALRPNGDVARFSNWGGQVDIYAPGEKILSTIPFKITPVHISRKGYDFKNGTSQAAPFISAAMAILKGLTPEASRDILYSRLVRGADSAPESKGLKGLFHLDKSVAMNVIPFVYPELKGIQSVVTDKSGLFTISLPFKNYGLDSAVVSQTQFSCDEAQIKNGSQVLPKLQSEESKVLTFEGSLKGEPRFINCALKVNQEEVSIRLKIVNKLNDSFKTLAVKQSELLVINTRTGARSRFTTLNAIKGTSPGPLYYVAGEKDITLYNEDRVIGIPVSPKDCKFLRVWQVDYDGDKKNELMMESLCDKTYLYYQFLDLELHEIYPSVKYKPTLSILNYDDFDIILQKGVPPSFRFMNAGFVEPTKDPWDSDVTGKAGHYYELYPVKDEGGFKYEIKALEDTAQWMKSLKLRYMPSYDVFHQIRGKLLVKIGQKTAWVDLKDQTAQWAGLEDVLLAGSRKQPLIGTSDVVLQSFMTPFEYRGYILDRTMLRFIQTDAFDPLIDILGTEKNSLGYKTILRSFQKLIYVQYDFSGNILEKKETVVDRFDFLNAQDMIASVINLVYDNHMIQVVDGTKKNTNYIDLIIDGSMKSLEIPSHCATQQPIILDGIPVLAIFCAKNKSEFEMRYIELAE
jgi:hypothetical protein